MFLYQQARNPESGFLPQEQSEAQRMDMEGTDRRGEMAGNATARASTTPARCTGATCARVLHVCPRILRRPAAQ